MIPVTRFLARSTDRPAWLAARRQGVTATTVALAATPAGFQQALNEFAAPVEEFDNPYMAFGREAEPLIAASIKTSHGLMPNDWLIQGENPTHLATPDALSLDHKQVGEFKSKTSIPKSIPRIHRDQMFWQMWCTDAESGIYAVNTRVDDGNGWFRLGLWEPATFPLTRDDKRIAELVTVADRLIEERAAL